MEEMITRQNPFCVISKDTFGKYKIRDIQTNSSWKANPYETDYAVVPDSMVQEILATKGFCDIVLNEGETEITSFTAREIPDIPEPESTPEPKEELTIEDMANAITEGVNEV